MGTRTHQEQRHHGAFGQSAYQASLNRSRRLAKVHTIKAILEVDESITKEQRRSLQKQLKELIQ